MPTTIGPSTSYSASVPLTTDTADIQVALRLLAYGTSSDPANNAAILTNSVFGKMIYPVQPNPTTLSATATLTIAQLLTYIIVASPTSAINLTLPTGTLSDTGINGGGAASPNNSSFNWSIINTSSTSGATVTLVAGTGHTIVGSATVAIGTSATFKTRKTATNTFITYRLA
jgi:hypothetical protein